ncbi:MAG: TfoX/Sxy family protein, partial [Flavobacteriales bacterium]
FGGLAFMYMNKMSVGVLKDEMTVRVIASKEDELLSRKGIRPMTFTGKPMKEFVFADPDVFKTDDQLNELIDLGLEHARQAQKGKK